MRRYHGQMMRVGQQTRKDCREVQARSEGSGISFVEEHHPGRGPQRGVVVSSSIVSKAGRGQICMGRPAKKDLSVLFR